MPSSDEVPVRPVTLITSDGVRLRGDYRSAAVALHRAGGGHGELWIEHGMGHGATGTSPALIHRVAGWARQATGDTPIEGTPIEGTTVGQDGEAA